jgi:hypothetical protein
MLTQAEAIFQNLNFSQRRDRSTNRLCGSSRRANTATVVL